MTILKQNYFLQLSLAVFVLSLAFVSPVRADPTVRLSDGVTTVQLSADLVGALAGLGVAPSATGPGTLGDDGVATFPIEAGGLDLETFNGDIFHSGGLSLTASDGTVVELFNFIIDNSGDQLAITALGTLNDDLAGRFPLFNLDFANAQIQSSDTDVTITGVVLSLTADGAAALNTAFAVDAFTENLNVGTANVEGLTDSTDDDIADDAGDIADDAGDVADDVTDSVGL